MSEEEVDAEIDKINEWLWANTEVSPIGKQAMKKKMENKLKKKSEDYQIQYQKNEVIGNIQEMQKHINGNAESFESLNRYDLDNLRKLQDSLIGDYNNSLSDNQAIGKLFKESKVEDSTDAWKVLREYMLSRISMRFDTLEEMEDEVNEKFKSIMEQIQGHYDSWFESELKQNYSVYGIEILGKDEDVIVEDEEELDESQLGKLDEEQPEERGNVEDIDFEEQ